MKVYFSSPTTRSTSSKAQSMSLPPVQPQVPHSHSYGYMSGYRSPPATSSNSCPYRYPGITGGPKCIMFAPIPYPTREEDSVVSIQLTQRQHHEILVSNNAIRAQALQNRGSPLSSTEPSESLKQVTSTKRKREDSSDSGEGCNINNSMSKSRRVSKRVMSLLTPPSSPEHDQWKS